MRPYLTTQSAREQRRAEQRRGRRRAAAPVRRPAVPVCMWADQMLSPIERIATTLHLDGALDVDDAGVPVLTDAMGGEWAAGPAIEGVLNLFEQWRTRHGADLDLSPLRELSARLQDGGTVSMSALDRVTALLSQMRGIALRMPPSEADSLIAGALIQNELES